MLNDVGNDLIWGAQAIAEAIGRTERITFHLLEKGEIPAKKVGGRWVASRTKLLEHLTSDRAA
jgi:hypothetical protein